MEELVGQYDLVSLFVLSFLAATLVPVGSEWLLSAMILNGSEPVAVVLTATAGNFLGACTTYGIGLWGGPFLVRRLLRIEPQTQARAERLYERYGVWSLLFSWLPVVGDPLCLVGGVLKVGFLRFSLLVLTGKIVRYAAVAGVIGWFV